MFKNECKISQTTKQGNLLTRKKIKLKQGAGE